MKITYDDENEQNKDINSTKEVIIMRTMSIASASTLNPKLGCCPGEFIGLQGG